MNGIDLPTPMRASRPRMMSTRELAAAVDGRAEGPVVDFFGVTTDSRAVTPGDLFFALQGERFDGHGYVESAVAQGAAAAVTRRTVGSAPQVIVGDTRLALGKLAGAWRARYALPLVALTGSNGKTTVKEMLTAILVEHAGSREHVLATEGNLNNDIGMPLTLLRLREHHRYAVIEMGMNHEGEIDYLTRIARPQVALVNNAQRAHVGILGSVEAIARAKGEIYGGLSDSGIAVLNEDDAFCSYWRSLNAAPRRVITFGMARTADVRGTLVDGALDVAVAGAEFTLRLRVAGEHNARNALAACAAAFALGVHPESMRAALEGFAGVPGRLQRLGLDAGGALIDDSYNANPESMKAAIQVLAAEPGRRVLVMGDMGELGEQSPQMHAEVGEAARRAGIDSLFTFGEASRQAAARFGANARHFADMEGLIEAVRAQLGAGATVLVKGSRFMRMERVVEALAGGRDAV